MTDGEDLEEVSIDELVGALVALPVVVFVFGLPHAELFGVGVCVAGSNVAGHHVDVHSLTDSLHQ